MGRPVWVTKAGDLGVISERQFYNLRFDVIDPDGGALTYTIVGGNLPSGISLKDDGFIEGTPTIRKVFIRGVPTDVAEDVVNTFAVRVKTETGDVSDRTFSLTVSGQDIPVITTTTEFLGEYFDGTFFEYQLEAVDIDTDPLVWAVSTGELPNGLTLDPSTGLISGHINVAIDEQYGQSGWFNTDWDQRPWDFGTQSISKYYQFTVSVFDGKDYALKAYKIYIISKDGMTADSTVITADNSSIITADTDNKRMPVMLTPEGDLGLFLHDNYFAYKFEGRDFDGDAIEFELVGAGLGSLTLDPYTGWYYGEIPSQALLEISYSLGVRVKKRYYTDYVSEVSNYTLSVIGDLGKFVKWTTDSDLGEITNGDISEFYVEATNGLGRTLYYRLADDFKAGELDPIDDTYTGDGSTTDFVITTTVDISSNDIKVYVDDVLQEKDTDWTLEYANTASDQEFIVSFIVAPSSSSDILISVYYPDVVDSATSSTHNAGKLPQGLKLLEDGTISGRVAFNGFTLDGATTTFDVEFRRTSSVEVPTTFDTVFTFTVEVYDSTGDISTFKTFSITVNLYNTVPYNNLYALGLISAEDRHSLEYVFSDPSVIDVDNVYRSSDPFFGVSKDIRLLVASGIHPASSDDMQSAVSNAHYNKRVRLGQIKTARALDSSDNVKYEVVYIVVEDSKITDEGVSSGRSLNLGNVSISGGFDPIIYPNSFENMRLEVYDAITQSNKQALPSWMNSKQSDGRVLGHINAAVLCYTKPGKSEEVAFRIRRSGINLSEFDIVLDRYIWDKNLTENYDLEEESFVASSETTFDKYSATYTELPLVGTVDFAVETPFFHINQRPLSYISEYGGFDGISSSFVIGKTMVFAKQENYDIDTELAWTDYTSKFDSEGFDSAGYDGSEVIPGYFDSTNERSGIYVISLSTAGLIELTLVQTIDTNEQIVVGPGGSKYGGKRLFYDPSVKVGNTVPDFSLLPEESLRDQTTFDSNGTRFFRFKDIYQEPDVGDSYIKWPQLGVFE